MSVAECRVMGRATQGVRLINLAKKNDVIASVCKVMSSEMESEVEEENNEELPNNAENIEGEASSAADNTEVTPVDFE